MQTINIENCSINDTYLSINSNNLKSIIERNTVSTTNEGDFTTFDSSLFDKIDDSIEKILYSIGLDKKLLEVNKFTTNEYFEILMNYQKEYEKDNSIKEKYKELAFQYQYNFLKHSNLILISDSYKLVEYNGIDTTLEIFYKFYNDNKDSITNKYKYLDEFVIYIEKLMEIDIERKEILKRSK